MWFKIYAAINTYNFTLLTIKSFKIFPLLFLKYDFICLISRFRGSVCRGQSLLKNWPNLSSFSVPTPVLRSLGLRPRFRFTYDTWIHQPYCTPGTEIVNVGVRYVNTGAQWKLELFEYWFLLNTKAKVKTRVNEDKS